MQILSLEQVRAALKSLDTWLARCGLKPKNDRIHALTKTVSAVERVLVEFRATRDMTRATDDLLRVSSGVAEAVEFLDIFNAFSSVDPKTIGPKLAIALSGPTHPAFETKKNSVGRNTMFELALAAEWKVRGIDVSVGEPDITVNLRGIPFFVECKRPFDASGIRSNVRGAARQLKEKLERPWCQTAMGIIALSVTRVFNPDHGLYIAGTEKKGQESLRAALTSLLVESERHWANAEFHPRIIAVLFHIATPAFIQDSGAPVSRMTFFTVKPIVKVGPALKIFEEEVMRRYQTGLVH